MLQCFVCTFCSHRSPSIVTFSQPLTKSCSTLPIIYLPTITHTLVPTAPTIVSVQAASSISISVQWKASKKDRGSSITGYVVGYRPTSNPASPFETQVVEQDFSSTTLESLIPSTEYKVRVRGENAVGRSDPSATKWTKTKADSCLQEVNFQMYK